MLKVVSEFINRNSCSRVEGCNVSPSPTDVSPTENSWMLHPLDKVSLGYYAPDRTIPSLNTDFLTALYCALCAVHVLCCLCMTRSRVGTHRSGAQYPREALSKGRNIQELSVGDTSVGDTSESRNHRRLRLEDQP